MPRRSTLALAAATAALATTLAACSSDSGTGGSATSAASGDGCSNAQVVATWDLKRRLGQMLMGSINSDAGESGITAAITAIAKGQVGGVNILGASTYAYSNNELAQAVDAGGQVPPFLAVDEEGGRVQRLADETGYIDSARVLRNTRTPHQVEKLGHRIGKVMRRLSLDMNLAPVVDVSNQPDDAVIGDRSFSNKPQVVTKYAGAFADGLRKADVIPVLKHFPGLGSGSGNTDFEPASTPPLSELEKTDLVPYETLLQDQPVAVMLTNASVPGLTSGVPATLSPQAYALLRDQYGFDGVAMTDSLSATAVQEGAGIEKAVRKALAAGADIALWDDLASAPRILKSLKKAVARGDLPEDRVNQSVARILALKGVDLCVGR